MQIFDTLDISATGLSAQRRKLTAIASNVANVDTTRTDEGGPYKRRRVVMLEAPKLTKFSTMLEEQRSRMKQTTGRHMMEGEPRPGEIFTGAGVLSQEVREEPIKPRLVYDPNHPDAREDGYVVYPDINVVTEMVDMIASSRAYEANATVLSAAKDMVNRSLEI
ncbi:MAG: flagellar basal body rod protein FlgC [Candidatus Latescibacterota bacterium]|jgi:flagellar basal-body rod protein FlgC|nr:flagellar basal body rod protein FlgC [Gemmatimonadota bacterium]MBI92528.1 flagellar basal body rod protein FlgC [Gemmatimonadaceae bacterium]MDP7634855.1 flagellar basal body rod protein FlgC [Candidatus Latescibacterota bacterium]MBU07520.1 flagellar basal body rod protein FlgC [Gemmatimonadota bacterium]MEC8991564.1 flagellar basal body rod protein FlgC [Candidatus Latescibacterota bacterium]|tara:strand:+ start:683 stop:1174 length:492 start_codon:yes stop_codon:yes gene_type:complete